jgi:ParB-like chromosome segregation protein Spo0J
MLTIDPQLQALCPPLNEEEAQQLEANLLADGCRDPLVVWPRDGTLVLVDGHHRYTICERHGLAYTVHEQAFASEEEAINWMIALQLGRRNLTSEQKSYLRGKRYNLEKRQDGGHGDQKSDRQNDAPIAEKLGEEYHVAPRTIERDGAFADALDTLENQVRADLREVVLKRQRNGTGKTTKKQATHAGKLMQERKVEPLPFMRREGWKPYYVLEAIEVLATFPQSEHAALNTFLDRPFLPADEGLKILRNLHAHSADQRQRIYALQHSPDPREQSLALTLAAKKAPEPDPQTLIAGSLVKAVEDVRQRQRRTWRLPYPEEPWTAILDQVDETLASVQDRWRAIAREAETLHKERIASYAEAFDKAG